MKGINKNARTKTKMTSKAIYIFHNTFENYFGKKKPNWLQNWLQNNNAFKTQFYNYYCSIWFQTNPSAFFPVKRVNTNTQQFFNIPILIKLFEHLQLLEY